MAASEATPRIHAPYLQAFTNQTVRILGKVVSLRGETATIEANGSIAIHLNRVSYLSFLLFPPRPLFLFFFVFFFFTLEGRSYSMSDVHCIHMQDSHLTINNAVEIVGKVQPDLSIKVFQATDFGDNIGMLKYLLDHLPRPLAEYFL